jgi:hypothetical protein
MKALKIKKVENVPTRNLLKYLPPAKGTKNEDRTKKRETKYIKFQKIPYLTVVHFLF